MDPPARWTSGLFAACLFVGLPTEGRAQPEAAVDAYCDFLKSSTAAERAQLLAPSVIGRVGLIQGGAEETGDGSVARGTTARTSIGLRYSLNDLDRARLLSRARSAECERRQADAALRRGLEDGLDVGLAPALEARAAVLAERLPAAVARLEQAREARRLGQLTDPRLVALRVRVDELRQSLRQTKAELSELRARASTHPEASLAELLDASRGHAREEARRELELRLARWWDVQLSGGYDQLWRIEQSAPVFATAQLELNVGRLFEGPARRDADMAYARYRQAGGEGRGRQIQELRAAVEARSSVVRDRLADVTALLRDIDLRLTQLEGAQSPLSEAYAQDLWFKEAQLLAEKAELSTLDEKLKRFLGLAFPE